MGETEEELRILLGISQELAAEIHAEIYNLPIAKRYMPPVLACDDECRRPYPFFRPGRYCCCSLKLRMHDAQYRALQLRKRLDPDLREWRLDPDLTSGNPWPEPVAVPAKRLARGRHSGR